MKAGFSDDDVPRVVIPTVLGRPASNSGPQPEQAEVEEDDKNEQIDIFVGEEALNNRNKNSFCYSNRSTICNL